MPDAPAPLAPEEEDRLFGQWLVRLNLVRPDQVESALADQARRRETGARVRLGQLLVEAGALSTGDVRQVLELQGKTLLVRPRCKDAFNVRDWRSFWSRSAPRTPCRRGRGCRTWTRTWRRSA